MLCDELLLERSYQTLISTQYELLLKTAAFPLLHFFAFCMPVDAATNFPRQMFNLRPLNIYSLECYYI